MLTKTLFKLAIECPVKVHYARDRRYVNARMDDEFLEALAKGGHQVGALAKLMFRAGDPEAVEILSRDRNEQLAQTRELLARDSVTVFEGTASADNLLIRADVLAKRGRVVDLVEVKAKSWDSREDSLIGLTARQAPIRPEWEPYVYDLAFQHHVLSQAFPELEFRPAFLFVDKSRVNSVPGLGTKIRWVGGDDHNAVEIDPDFDIATLDPPLLIHVDAAEAVQRAKSIVRPRKGRPALEFYPLIEAAANSLASGIRPEPHLSSVCKSCEFYCPPTQRAADRCSGWAECMEARFGRAADRPREESIFGFYEQSPTEKYLAAGRLWMSELEEDDLEVKPGDGSISRSERQSLQWLEVKHRNTALEVLRQPVTDAMGDWRFPLHFIDFETAAPALPFHAGMRPYQHILFQFSHHVVESDGQTRHANECLVVDGAESPSIEVVRRLRDAIGNDQGTVIHWYPHERTILKSVRDEIEAAGPEDAAGLIEFLDGLGLEKDARGRMFDLGRLVARCVFLPGTGGSSSMKRFLPAALRLSNTVRARYAEPIYGTPELPSLNFTAKAWVIEGGDGVLDPYKLLDPLFTDNELSDALAELELREGEFVANGAAAMIAYATLQDPRLPESDKNSLKAQLKRYCELDTLAMVMVYEALREWAR